jgi:D-glycero-D-manno-heptose 1,7-bisphosphate phosphatase
VKRAVFLDRDGVLNALEPRGGRLRAPVTLAAFRLLPGAADAVRRLRDGGFVCLVATNQPEVAGGELDPVVLEAMHARLRQETGVDGIYVCPHVDADGCACRKPQPGLLLRAATDWNVDVAGSFLIGDRWRDIEAGAAAGCTTVLLEGSSEPSGRPDVRAATLADAVAIIMKAREAR